MKRKEVRSKVSRALSRRRRYGRHGDSPIQGRRGMGSDRMRVSVRRTGNRRSSQGRVSCSSAVKDRKISLSAACPRELAWCGSPSSARALSLPRFSSTPRFRATSGDARPPILESIRLERFPSPGRRGNFFHFFATGGSVRLMHANQSIGQLLRSTEFLADWPARGRGHKRFASDKKGL